MSSVVSGSGQVAAYAKVFIGGATYHRCAGNYLQVIVSIPLVEFTCYLHCQ